ncbi:diguanylate cyclase [Candidatus Falkowbacteria bacterium]|jgi:diguanylate cyclase (GGDEF)-like protein|nr:diguanylate cyclase [Candidatus Falkowbacteria bacterium]MBT7006900.1 diguanylate cyclase [Candidatus Falkowbacteria bacterium]
MSDPIQRDLREKSASSVSMKAGIVTIAQPTLDPSQINILWVDDEPHYIDPQVQSLRGAGFNVFVANNEQAVRELVDKDDSNKMMPDIVLMDVNLGRKNFDGFDMIRLLKHDLEVDCGYVIITAYDLNAKQIMSMERLKAEGLIAGIINKPIGDSYSFILNIELAISISQALRNVAIDFLTQIPLRRVFQAALMRELGDWFRSYYEWQRDPTKIISIDNSISVLLFDIDDFSKVNNTHGHAVGDQVLADFANTVRSLMRGRSMFARYGGEEFVALLPNTTFEEAFKAAQRISVACTKRSVQQIAYYRDRLTTSIGIATITYELVDKYTMLRSQNLAECATDYEKFQMQLRILMELLIAIADAGMYRAKYSKNEELAAGRKIQVGFTWPHNAVEYYNPETGKAELPEQKK